MVTFPNSCDSLAHFKIRKVGCAGEYSQGYRTFLVATLQIIHNERRLLHVSHIKFCLRANDLESQMEPCILGKLDGGGEARTVVNLPVQASVQHRRVLYGIW